VHARVDLNYSLDCFLSKQATEILKAIPSSSTLLFFTLSSRLTAFKAGESITSRYPHCALGHQGIEYQSTRCMVFDFDIANGVLRAHAFWDDDKWGWQHPLQGIL